MQINILKNIKKVPGGMMLVPMLITALINSFSKKALYIGNPLTAMFTSKGTMTIIGIMIFCIGIQIDPSQIKNMLKRGGILLGLKLIINIIFGILVIKYFGSTGFLGLSAIALVSCITSCNPGLYIALMQDCGDSIDKSTFILMNIVGLPFIPVCILNFASGGGFNISALLATCIPFFLGMLLGYLDADIKEFSKDGVKFLIPFMGFCLGSSVNIFTLVTSWSHGILLYLVYMLVNWPILFLVDRKLLKQNGHSSTAICCVAGLSLTVPPLISGSSPVTSIAVAQLSFVVIIGAITTPIFVQKLARNKTVKTKNEEVTAINSGEL